MGGVLFIDEAYYLYKPDNERDYGAEAVILGGIGECVEQLPDGLGHPR